MEAFYINKLGVYVGLVINKIDIHNRGQKYCKGFWLKSFDFHVY